jgi:hypothetical protein
VDGEVVGAIDRGFVILVGVWYTPARCKLISGKRGTLDQCPQLISLRAFFVDFQGTRVPAKLRIEHILMLGMIYALLWQWGWLHRWQVKGWWKRDKDHLPAKRYLKSPKDCPPCCWGMDFALFGGATE